MDWLCKQNGWRQNTKNIFKINWKETDSDAYSKTFGGIVCKLTKKCKIFYWKKKLTNRVGWKRSVPRGGEGSLSALGRYNKKKT